MVLTFWEQEVLVLKTGNSQGFYIKLRTRIPRFGLPVENFQPVLVSCQEGQRKHRQQRLFCLLFTGESSE